MDIAGPLSRSGLSALQALARLGIVERLPPNGQAGRALAGPGCGDHAGLTLAGRPGRRFVEKECEGLAIGPRLADASHLVVAGTDNDYWVTQDAGSVQRDVYFKPLPAGGVSRIICDIGTFTNCLNSQQLTKPDTPTAFNCVTLS